MYVKDILKVLLLVRKENNRDLMYLPILVLWYYTHTDKNNPV